MDLGKNTICIPACELACYARFDPGNFSDAEKFSPRTGDGVTPFAKWMRMFLEGQEWDARFPAIIQYTYGASPRIVEGSHRIQSLEFLDRNRGRKRDVPTVHCRTPEQCHFALWEIYPEDAERHGVPHPNIEINIPCPPQSM